MTYFLSVLFRWPDGIVLGNLMASLLWAVIVAAAVGALWLLRNVIARRVVAFWHRHHTEHLARLTADPEQDKGVPGG